MLGGNAEYMARLKLRELLMPKVVTFVDDDSVTPAAMMALKVVQEANYDHYH